MSPTKASGLPKLTTRQREALMGAKPGTIRVYRDPSLPSPEFYDESNKERVQGLIVSGNGNMLHKMRERGLVRSGPDNNQAVLTDQGRALVEQLRESES